MPRKLVVGCLLLICLVVVAVPVVLPTVRQLQLRHRVELDFAKLVEQNADNVYLYYPEILTRILRDDQVSRQIRVVHLSSLSSGDDYTALARLPNVEELHVMYAHNVDRIIPIVNEMPKLRIASFAYCKPSDSWLLELNSATLESLQLHGYWQNFFDETRVAAFRDNVPKCTIAVTADEDSQSSVNE